MTAAETVLASRILADLVDLEQTVSHAELLRDRADQRADDEYLYGAALELHAFYTGVEKIFEEIARYIDGSVPSGPAWHRDLLAQMATQVIRTRPPVIQHETRDCLEKYLGFRHVVRNVYTHKLQPARVRELCADLRVCYQALYADVQTFCSFLEHLDQKNGQE